MDHAFVICGCDLSLTALSLFGNSLYFCLRIKFEIFKTMTSILQCVMKGSAKISR